MCSIQRSNLTQSIKIIETNQKVYLREELRSRLQSWCYTKTEHITNNQTSSMKTTFKSKMVSISVGTQNWFKSLKIIFI